MDNLKCSKCKNAVICKFKDELDRVEEQFPFIESFTCKFYEAQVKKPKVETTAETPAVKTETPKTRGPRKKKIEETVETPIKETKPEPKKDTKPKTDNKKPSEDFKGLPIESVGFKSNVSKALVDADIHIVADLYDKKKTKALPKTIIDEVNYKLLIFNQPQI